MLEEAIPSLWNALLSWFTPAVFFVLLNLVIGTIAVTSKGTSSAASTAGEHHGHAATLKRAPSLVLDRLRSFTLSRYPSHEIPTETGHLHSETDPAAGGGAYAGDRRGSALTRAPSLVLDRLRSFTLSRFVSGEVQAESVELEPAMDLVESSDSQVEEHDEHYNEHHIERSQSDAQPPQRKLPERMKKSASNKSAFSHFEEAEIVQPPRAGDEDREVDAKADDFINKFRNQLKLQRLDSILRYKEMITRGAAN